MNNVFLYGDDFEIAMNETEDPRRVLVALRLAIHTPVEELDTVSNEQLENDPAAIWYFKRLAANIKKCQSKKRTEKPKAPRPTQAPDYLWLSHQGKRPNNGGYNNGGKRVYIKDNRANGYYSKGERQ